MVRGEPPEAGSDLPAPYRSPWRSLAEALQAVAAALLLKGRELWRRNHQGQLPLPRIWPRPLAALFWPLLLGLAVPAALLLVMRLPGLPPRSPLAAAPGPEAPLTIGPAGAAAGIAAPAGQLPSPAEALPPTAGGVQGQAERGSTEQDRSTRGSAGPGEGPQNSPAQNSPAQDSAAQDSREKRRLTGGRAAADPPARFSPALASSEAAADPGGPPRAEPPAAPLQLDPLLALLSDREDRDLLLAAQPDPTTALLRLRLSERGDALSDQALLERAARWQQRALEAGYERLELVAAAGGLRARQALVGSGMILVAPAASPP
ncbi:MAG: hypothetical protein VKJ44_09170 [Synechococcus sp.]|nr:hypothetical protein [Synechococcus sp.]